MARDHYVPQFYLRNFQIPRKRERVYVYTRGAEPQVKSIREIAQEEDYYDLKRNDPTVDKDGIDKLLLLSERTAAPVITKLLTASSWNVAGKDVGYLSWFVGLLGARTPAVRETIASIQIGINSREFKKMLRDDTEFERMLKEHPEMTKEQLQQAREAFLNDDIRLEFKRGGETEDFLMGSQLQFANILVDILQNRDWILMETASSLSFLTSDKPVVDMPVPDHPRGETWGYANGNILLPLSPKRALMFAVRGDGSSGIRFRTNVLQVHRKRMPEIQFYIITQCRSAVYSHVLSKEFQHILDSIEEGKAQTASVAGA